jgi:hypothetical protein
MERLIHETRETFMALMIASCLAVGIGGAVIYTLGPDGWLVDTVRAALLDPNLSTLASLFAVIGILAMLKRLLDRYSNASALNNLLVGAVGLGGFVIILQSVRTVIS